MKFILPLLICVFIAGCTFPNFPVQTKQNNTQQKTTPTQKIITKNKIESNDTVFSKKYDIQKEHVYSNLNNTIIDIGNQLFDTRSDKKNPTRVILTAFVDLNKLEETSTFGRLVSESMFNELHIRKFQVTDFRGRDAVTVTEDGEFHITRDVLELKDNIDAVEYILVGTYVKFEDQSLLINARILDSESGRVESSARVIYRPRDCSLFGICEKEIIVEKKVEKKQTLKATKQTEMMKKKFQPEPKKINNSPIMIVKDK